MPFLGQTAGHAEMPAAEPAPKSFASLLEKFKETSGLEARFEEEKFLALLALPLRSSGRLYFAPPSTLLRRVETPRERDILVANDHVRITDSNGEQSIDLAARDDVRPLVESMLWIFTGDLASLEEIYHVDYQVLESADTRASHWEVKLVPRRPPLSQLIRELRVSGHGRVTDTLELTETSGDRTVTRIIGVDASRIFSASERHSLFGEMVP